jgi:hypothetical protein
MPGVSITSMPVPWISRAAVVVWRPRPITSFTAPVCCSPPVTVLTSVDLPTPEWPANAASRPAISLRTARPASAVRASTSSPA